MIVAPSERAVVDVLFDSAGAVALEHRTPETTYRLGSVSVAGEVDDPAPAAAFGTLRSNPEWRDLRALAQGYRDEPADKSIAFVADRSRFSIWRLMILSVPTLPTIAVIFPVDELSRLLPKLVENST